MIIFAIKTFSNHGLDSGLGRTVEEVSYVECRQEEITLNAHRKRERLEKRFRDGKERLRSFKHFYQKLQNIKIEFGKLILKPVRTMTSTECLKDLDSQFQEEVEQVQINTQSFHVKSLEMVISMFTISSWTSGKSTFLGSIRKQVAEQTATLKSGDM